MIITEDMLDKENDRFSVGDDDEDEDDDDEDDGRSYVDNLSNKLENVMLGRKRKLSLSSEVPNKYQGEEDIYTHSSEIYIRMGI